MTTTLRSPVPGRPRLVGEAPLVAIAFERLAMMVKLFRPRLPALLDRAGLRKRTAVALYNVRSGGVAATMIARTNSYDIRTLNEVWGSHAYDRWISAPLTADSVVVDLGANCGYFSVLAGCAGAGRLIAVEPHPENIRILRANAALNDVEIDVVEGAVVAQPTPTPLRLTVSKNPRLHSLVISDRDEIGSIEVAGVAVNEILERVHHRRIDVLKVDIEGGEWQVIDAIDDEHLRRIELVVTEADESPPSSLVDRLSEAGLPMATDPPYYAFARCRRE